MLSRLPPRFLLILLPASLPAAAFAQGASITSSPVVVTATRVEQNSFDLPVSIDSIPASGMQNGRLMLNAAESLVRVPGVVAPNTFRLSSDQQVSIRGFGTRSSFGIRGIRLYADGIPQTMPDGQGQVGTFALASAERMEVLRGPFSALYGNSSGGVIQIFTRDGKGDPRYAIDVQAGSYGTWRAGVVAEGRSGDLGFVLDGSRFSTDGYRDHSAARKDQINAKLNWTYGSNTRATLLVGSVDQPYNDDPQGLTRAQMNANPRQAPASSFTANMGGSKSQTHVGLNLEHRVSASDSLQLTGWGGVREVLTRLATGRSTIDRDFQGLDARWTHSGAGPAGKFRLTLGASIESMKDDRKGYSLPGALNRNEDNLASSNGLYVQGELEPSERLMLSAGLRSTRVKLETRDRFVNVGNIDDSGAVRYSNTSPVIGAVYRLAPAVNLYANAGRGFETPTLIEMAYTSTAATGGAPNFGLRPSTSSNLEIGVKALVGDASRVNAALFSTRTAKEIVVDQSAGGRTVYANAGRTQRSGFELAFESNFAPDLDVYLAATRIDARFKDSFVSSGGRVLADNLLPATPKTTAFAELTWRHPTSGFATALEAFYSGKAFVDDRNTEAADAYTLLNWRGGFEQKLGAVVLKEFLRIDNLTDTRYVGGILVNNASPYAPAPGRTFMVGLSLAAPF